MINNKVLLGGIIGGIIFFVLGWLIYGMLLTNFMAAHSGINAATAAIVNKGMEQFGFGWIALGNLASGFLLAIIFSNYGNITTAMAGAKAAGIIGFLVSVGFDSIMYGTSNLMTKKGMLADVLAFTVMNMIVGAIIAAIIGMKKKAE